MRVVANLRRRAGALLSPEARRFNACRRRLAERYLQGDGIEIGALHQPLAVPPAARVRFVDRYDVDDLRTHYPELAGLPLVPVDVIDDGEMLATFADASMDFIIANHFLEHTQDPLATLRTHLRVVRPSGVLYLAVPDKRRTFDIEREVTPLEHLLRDLDEGPQWSRTQHFREWAQHVEKAPDVEACASKLMADDYSIHFHVWTPDAFAELLDHARDVLGMPFCVEVLEPNEIEFIAVLRRSP